MAGGTMTDIRVIFTVLVGVASLRVALSTSQMDQSEADIPYDQPMAALENDAGKRRIETPEVVLQLKYDRGELNRIYLAQFRKEKELWQPSVPARTNLCADLCHAGLGGTSCGTSCLDMLPVGLQAALRSGNKTESTYGEPRIAVCPMLCRNHLGEPLCNCASTIQGATEANEAEESEAVQTTVNWSEICTTFCITDRYVLSGCPPCDASTTIAPQMASTRILNTVDGWTAWCGVQCNQGQGGAACNCDRAPFQ